MRTSEFSVAVSGIRNLAEASALHLSSSAPRTMPKFAKNVERLESHHDVGLRVSALQVQFSERLEVIDDRISFILAKFDGLTSGISQSQTVIGDVDHGVF